MSKLDDSGSLKDNIPLMIKSPLMVSNGTKQLVSTKNPNNIFPNIAPKRPATY